MKTTTSAADDICNYFVFWDDVKCLTNSSEATIRRAIKNKKFPPTVPLFGNKGKVGFRRLDILLYCEGRWTPEG